MEVGNGVAVAGRGRFPDAQSLNRAESVAHVVEPERLGVVVDAAAGLLALMDVEHRCVDSAVLRRRVLRLATTPEDSENLDVASPAGTLIVVTRCLSVDLPGIEPLSKIALTCGKCWN